MNVPQKVGKSNLAVNLWRIWATFRSSLAAEHVVEEITVVKPVVLDETHMFDVGLSAIRTVSRI